MPFCTIAEFEWDENFGRERFTRAFGDAGREKPAGRLTRITGIDGKGARIIEVWRSGDDAQAFAEKSRPLPAAARLPAPSRVVGFEVTPYVVA